MCEATLKVIEWRLKQSDAVIFVRTSNSLNSIWCKYELNYFKELKKPIYCIDGEQLKQLISILKNLMLKQLIYSMKIIKTED